MRRRLALSAVIASLLIASGCALTTPVAKLAPVPSEGIVSTGSRQVATFKGVAIAPSSLLSQNGSSLVGNNSSGLISDKAAGYALLATDELAPVADAEVEVQDAGGNPVPGVPKVKTDAKGEFTVKNVPADVNWVVEVKTTGFHLTTIVRPTQASAKAVEVSPATTAVTEHLRQSFGQNKAALRQVQPDNFDKLATEVKGQIEKDGLKVDLKPDGKAADVLNLVASHDGGIGQEVKAIVQAAKDAHEAAKAKGEDDDSDAGKPAAAPDAKPSTAPNDHVPADAGKPSAAPSAAAGDHANDHAADHGKP